MIRILFMPDSAHMNHAIWPDKIGPIRRQNGLSVFHFRVITWDQNHQHFKITLVPGRPRSYGINHWYPAEQIKTVFSRSPAEFNRVWIAHFEFTLKTILYLHRWGSNIKNMTSNDRYELYRTYVYKYIYMYIWSEDFLCFTV